MTIRRATHTDTDRVLALWSRAPRGTEHARRRGLGSARVAVTLWNDAGYAEDVGTARYVRSV